MKKILIVTLVCGLMFSGCSTQEETTDGINIEALVDEIIVKDFDNLMASLDETIVSLVSVPQLNALVDACMRSQTVTDDAEIVETIQGNITNYQVYVPLLTVKMWVNINVENDKIVGINFGVRPLNLPLVENDDFIETDILIGNESLPITGRLTMPSKIDNPPLVIMVGGSGQTGMDSAIGASGNAILKDLAHGLAKEGIASIRYNKRTLEYQLTNTDDLLDQEYLLDIEDIIAYASSLEGINAEQIYLLGHSQGGMIAPYVMSENEGLKGLIIMASSPRKFEDIVLSQQIAELDKMEIPVLQKDAALAQVKDENKKIKELDENSEGYMMGLPAIYLYQLSQIADTEYLSDISYPTLIMHGSADFQVTVEEDYQRYQTLLDDNANVEFKLYDNLNHMFMPSDGTKTIAEYNAPNTVDEDVIVDIVSFIDTTKN